MHIGLDQNINAADAVEGDLDVLVIPPVAHAGHVCAVGLVLFVACKIVMLVQMNDSFISRPTTTTELTFSEHNIRVKTLLKFPTRLRLLPRVVVKAAFNIAAVLVAMEPNICTSEVSITSFPQSHWMRVCNILGTKISLSCATKSSIMFFGLSLISTSRQYTQLCSGFSAADRR
jgi:hypothetical protein